MKDFALILLVAVAAPAAACAQEAGQDAAIRETITNQMQAFRQGDVAGAFQYASPTIKGLFGSSDNFGLMVQRGYPMVWAPGDVQFLELREVAGNLWQRVMVTDGAGRTHLLDYQMVQGPDGWEINGVQLLQAPGVGA